MEHPDFGKPFPCVCTQERRAEQLRQQELTRVQSVFPGNNLPVRYSRLTFDTFDALPDEKKIGKEFAFECCVKFAESGVLVIDGVELPGLMLCGSCGLGKSGLASSTTQHITKTGKLALWIDYTTFLRKVQATYRNTEGPTGDEVIGAAAQVPFLIIDDLGDVERDKAPITDDQRRITYQLISSRHSAMLPTLITTNLDIDQLYAQFGPRISDRILELCHLVTIAGNNLRFGD